LVEARDGEKCAKLRFDEAKNRRSEEKLLESAINQRGSVQTQVEKSLELKLASAI